MKLSDHQWEFLKDLAALILWAENCGYKLTGGDLYRSESTQARLVESGLSRTMRSQHRKKLAIDLNLFIDGTYQQSTDAYLLIGLFWESLSSLNVWGGRWQSFPDGNHFERRA